MKKYFITGAGTGIGKTFITAALSRQLILRGHTVTALKPVISGFDPQHADISDTGALLKACGLPVIQKNIEAISPWRFPDPISPDMAAENTGQHISFLDVVSFCRKKYESEYTLIEGVGGVMSPIDEKHTVLDWINELAYDTLLVAGNYLGAISHTLTAAETLIDKKIPLKAIILSEDAAPPVSAERTLLTLRRFLPTDIPVHLVRRDEHSANLADILS